MQVGLGAEEEVALLELQQKMLSRTRIVAGSGYVLMLAVRRRA